MTSLRYTLQAFQCTEDDAQASNMSPANTVEPGANIGEEPAL